MRAIDASLADIYVFVTPLQKNFMEINQEGCYLKAVAASSADNIYSNDPIGYQLQNGKFILKLR